MIDFLQIEKEKIARISKINDARSAKENFFFFTTLIIAILQWRRHSFKLLVAYYTISLSDVFVAEMFTTRK